MANDINKIFEQAKAVIVEKNLFFIEDVVAFLPISKKTYYEYFPIGSNESDTLKELLEINKVNVKVKMRKNWQESESPVLQLALMKIVSTNEELMKLSMNHNINTPNEETVNIIIE